MRTAIIAAGLSLSIIGVCFAQTTTAAINRIETRIPPQPLASAIKTFAESRHVQVLYLTAELKDLRTTGASGNLTVDETLNRLLSGTGLTYRYVDNNAVSIIPLRPLRDARGPSVPSQDDGEEGKKSSSGGFRLAQAAGATSQESPAALNGGMRYADASPRLREVVVTAEKNGPEPIHEVPVPLTVVSAAILDNQGEGRLQDYFSAIPSLTVTPSEYGAPTVTIRGLVAIGGNPTVGVLVDGVPYGASTQLGGGFELPDFDPSELSRIVELRGPQGTLYGANSLGGLLNFETANPSMQSVSGHMEVGGDAVNHADGDLGYNVRGALNVPVSQVFAVRASAFARQDPGYVSDVITGQKAINRSDAEGGYFAALLKPSDAISFKLSALLQDSNVHGSGFATQDLQTTDTVQGAGFLRTKVQAYSAILHANLGGAQFTSLSGYSVNTFRNSVDYSPVYGFYTQKLFDTPGALLTNTNRTTKFSQELRLSRNGQRLDWLLGGFFTHESSLYDDGVAAAVPSTGQVVGSFADIPFPTTYQEAAAFGNLTLHFTDRIDLQLGARESQNRQTYSVTWYGPFVSTFFGIPAPFVLPHEDTKDNSFTYLVTPRFKVSDQLMLYARVASGYRPGGPNSESGLSKLPTFGPDKTQNYEFGVKGYTLNHLLGFDASVYYIKWKNIQIQEVLPVSEVEVTANGNDAKSQGVELSVDFAPINGFTVSGWVTYNDAALTQAFPAAAVAAGLYGNSGDRLPYASRFSGHLAVDEEFPLVDDLTGFIGADGSYVGGRLGDFRAEAQTRQDFPAYAKLDLHGGLRRSLWTLTVYANNIADRRGELGGGLDYAPNPKLFYFIQPRTIGLSVGRSF